MAEFQPPEGLRKIIREVLDANEWHGIAITSASSRADAVLAALFEACEVRDGDDPYSAGFFAGYSRGSEDRINEIHKAGRLLPPGGEVTEETEWAVQHKLDDGNVNTSNPFYRREHAEWRTWGFHFGQQEPGVVVRRRIWAGPWSPVLSDNSEGESSD